MNKKLIAGIAAAVLLAGGGIGITAATAASTPTAERGYVAVELEKQASVVQPVAVQSPEPTIEPAPEVIAEQPAPAPEPPAAPAPIRCPAGSYPNSSDGVNDTSCWPAECATVTTFPDPAYPQCDVAFRP